jgi:hypothetical protein
MQDDLFTKGKSISYAVDSLASHFQSQDEKRERKITATSGRKCFDLYSKSSPLGSLVKMLLTSLIWHSPARKLTWKVKATPCSHLLFQLVPSERPIEETECGLLPTPRACDVIGGDKAATVSYENNRFVRTSRKTGTKFGAKLPQAMNCAALLPTPMASDAKQGAIIGRHDKFYITSTGMPRKINGKGTDGSVGLARLARLLPTMTASEHKGSGRNRYVGSKHFRGAKMSEGLRTTSTDPIYLNPCFAEKIMGFPQGWTDLNPSETQ